MVARGWLLAEAGRPNKVERIPREAALRVYVIAPAFLRGNINSDGNNGDGGDTPSKSGVCTVTTGALHR
jgi:hypothetical protein